MTYFKPTIIVIGYNREQSIGRLLDSLENAKYPDNDIRLIISIDKSDKTEVIEFAQKFKWSHGDKIVIKREHNMGLRAHVLSCGDFVDEYGSVILLEDDLVVSPEFYFYAQYALNFCENEEKIAGISLYNHMLNVYTRESFEAVEDGYDNWYGQIASSWGQCYTKRMWNEFKDYYEIHKTSDLRANNFPISISMWSDKSWLKYYMKYLVDEDKFFLYPRVSLTTNFTDQGVHNIIGNNDFQVPLLYGSISWNFSKLENSGSIYDIFFESMKLSELYKDTIIDLYGEKGCMVDEGYRYLLSSKSYPCKVVKSWGLRMRPHEMNIFFDIPGNDIFLYSIKEPAEGRKINEMNRIHYNYKALETKLVVKKWLRSKVRGAN